MTCDLFLARPWYTGSIIQAWIQHTGFAVLKLTVVTAVPLGAVAVNRPRAIIHTLSVVQARVIRTVDDVEQLTVASLVPGRTQTFIQSLVEKGPTGATKLTGGVVTNTIGNDCLTVDTCM